MNTPYKQVLSLWKAKSSPGGRVRRIKNGNDFPVEVLLPLQPTDWEEDFIAKIREMPVLEERWTHLLTCWGEEVRCWWILFDPSETYPSGEGA